MTVLPREPIKVAFRVVHTDDAMLRGLALEYLTGVLPESVRVRLWDILDAGTGRSESSPASTTALEELLRSQDGLLEQLNRQITASSGDAPGQSDPQPPTTARSAPR